MSKILIKIVGESLDGNPVRQMGGLSGLTYDFHWNTTFGCFVYVPRSQEEIDDILAVNWAVKRFPWRFSVMAADGIDVVTEAPGQPAKKMFVTAIPPYVKPEHYANYPAVDLVDLARSCGFSPEGDLTDTGNLLRQLHAYFVGRAFAIEQEKQLRAQLEAAKPEPIVAVVSPPAPEAPAPFVQEVKAAKPDRAAKAREAKAKKRQERLQGGVKFVSADVPRAVAV